LQLRSIDPLIDEQLAFKVVMDLRRRPASRAEQPGVGF